MNTYDEDETEVDDNSNDGLSTNDEDVHSDDWGDTEPTEDNDNGQE